MRNELKKANRKRLTFSAIVDRFGNKRNWHGFPEKTILLKDVRFADTKQLATDHIWFTLGKTIEAMELKEGDEILFDARIGNYIKGYVNYRDYTDDRVLDYNLNRPTKFKKLNDSQVE